MSQQEKPAQSIVLKSFGVETIYSVAQVQAVFDQALHLESQLTAEREASKRLVEALEFYADRQKYLDHAVNISIPRNKKKTSSIGDDMGRISRLALSEYKKARGEG